MYRRYDGVLLKILMIKKRLRVKVFGTVQGVFFRHSARIKFQELGIEGVARNESDGSVSIEAEGEEETLQKLLEWCKKGPPLARVERVEVCE